MAQDHDRTLTIKDSLIETQSPGRPYLVALTGPDAGRTYRLSEGSMTVGRAKSADVRVLDDDVSRDHARLICIGGNVVVEDLGSRNGTFVNGARVSRQVLADGDKVSVGETTILKFSMQDEIDEDFHDRMFRAARRDPLTGTFRRAFFEHRLDVELTFAKRHEAPLAVLFIDLDHFKTVNDTYGHSVGDRLLTEVATLLHKGLRQEDLLARYGGEEFAILVHGVDIAGAASLAERLRRSVAEHRPSTVPKAGFRQTVSVGLAGFPYQGIQDARTLMAAADAAMYTAKKRGRNRVVKYEGA